MLELAAVIALAFGGGLAFTTFRRARRHGAWKRHLAEVSTRLGARSSAGTMFDQPELRAEVAGRTITLRLLEGYGSAGAGRAEAEAPLPETLTAVRLYLGWGVERAPAGLEHVPPVPHGPKAGLEGPLTLLAEDGALASRILEGGALDLIDVRREARARVVELTVRGGYLKLAVTGLVPSPHVLERLVRATGRLAELLEIAARGTQLPAGNTPPEPRPAPAPLAAAELRCALCVERPRAGERWVRCARCAAPYHQTCFTQATACIEGGCGETRSAPLAVD